MTRTAPVSFDGARTLLPTPSDVYVRRRSSSARSCGPAISSPEPSHRRGRASSAQLPAGAQGGFGGQGQQNQQGGRHGRRGRRGGGGGRGGPEAADSSRKDARTGAAAGPRDQRVDPKDSEARVRFENLSSVYPTPAPAHERRPAPRPDPRRSLDARARPDHAARQGPARAHRRAGAPGKTVLMQNIAHASSRTIRRSRSSSCSSASGRKRS